MPSHRILNFNSDWQSERANTLHRLFKTWDEQKLSGSALNLVIRRTSRRLNGKPFKSNLRHHWAVSVARIYQLYRKWRQEGYCVSALNLNYWQPQRRVWAPVLIRFVNFWAGHDFESLRAAWEVFCRHDGIFGLEPVRSDSLKLSYDSLLSNLPSGFVREMARCKKDSHRIQAQIIHLQLSAVREIIRRVPTKLSKPQNQI